MQTFKVTIDQFDGPLDLMLHLIKEKKLDLFNLDLSVLATQYLEYIQQMQKMHLEVASEYLYELSNLVEFKSNRLLPKDTSELEDNYEEDNRERLVNRLLEYQRYKEASQSLQKLNEERNLQYDKPESVIVNQWRKDTSLPEDEQGNMADLLKAMNQCIKRYQILKPLPVSVARKEITAEERTEQLTTLISQLDDSFTLEDLCSDCVDVFMVITTFLAILDMIRLNKLEYTIVDDVLYLKRGIAYAGE